MNITSALVRSILEASIADPSCFQWTVQGFGFARVKIANVGRIHVWDHRLTVPLVSTMHTHPWSLRSTIISGELINCRFYDVDKDFGLLPYIAQDIATGEGGGLLDEPRDCLLVPHSTENYVPGDTYEQEPSEIHRSIAQPGTVTLMERPQGPPLERATVYWPRGSYWVSAEPRPIRSEELFGVLHYALDVWSAV